MVSGSNLIRYFRGMGRSTFTIADVEINLLTIEIYGYSPKDTFAGLFENQSGVSLEFHFGGTEDLLIIENILSDQNLFDGIYFNRFTSYESSADIKSGIIDVIELYGRSRLVNLIYLMEDIVLNNSFEVGTKDIDSSITFNFFNPFDGIPNVFVGFQKGKESLSAPNTRLSPTLQVISQTAQTGKVLVSGMQVNLPGFDDSWKGYQITLVGVSPRNSNWMELKAEADMNSKSVLDSDIFNKHIEIINFMYISGRTIYFTNKYYEKPEITLSYSGSNNPFIIEPVTELDSKGIRVFTGLKVIALPGELNTANLTAFVFAADKVDS